MEDLRKEFGKHYLVEFCDCDKEKLKYVNFVQESLLKAAVKSQATILQQFFHQFDPFGVSGVVFIAESHFSIHTWPEDRYAGLDILTCGEMCPELAIEELRMLLEAKTVKTKVIARGI